MNDYADAKAALEKILRQLEKINPSAARSLQEGLEAPFVTIRRRETGSSTLYSQLLEANLIDRFLLLTCPIVLGKGKKLFGSTSHPVNMKLVRNDISSTGVIIATYEHNG